MLKVRDHSELLSAQYLARCLEPGNVSHSITTREIPKKPMKETLFKDQKKNIVLDDLQASLRVPGSSDDINSVRPMEQTNGLYPGIQLSRGGKPRLKRTKI